MDLKSNHPLAAQSGEPCDPPRIGVEHADGQRLPDAPGDYVRR
jgi:polyhydroxyalkanoate synthase